MDTILEDLMVSGTAQSFLEGLMQPLHQMSHRRFARTRLVRHRQRMSSSKSQTLRTSSREFFNNLVLKEVDSQSALATRHLKHNRKCLNQVLLLLWEHRLRNRDIRHRLKELHRINLTLQRRINSQDRIRNSRTSPLGTLKTPGNSSLPAEEVIADPTEVGEEMTTIQGIIEDPTDHLEEEETTLQAVEEVHPEEEDRQGEETTHLVEEEAEDLDQEEMDQEEMEEETVVVPTEMDQGPAMDPETVPDRISRWSTPEIAASFRERWVKDLLATILITTLRGI